MPVKFFTNTDENTLLRKFEGVFTYNPNIKFFDALAVYFRASGYFRIRPARAAVGKCIRNAVIRMKAEVLVCSTNLLI